MISIVREGEGFAKRSAEGIAYGIAETEGHDGFPEREGCAKNEGSVRSAAKAEI